MMAQPRYISVGEVSQFKYNSESGGVIRLSGKGKLNCKPSKSTGYITYDVTLNKIRTRCAEHRLVYLLHNPKMNQCLQVDHVNGLRTDNRIENLRIVTVQENAFNRSNALGFSWHKANCKFEAGIEKDGVRVYLGYHETILDARAAYLRCKKEYHIIEGQVNE